MKKPVSYVIFSVVCAVGAFAARADFYSDYGIDDPVAFSAMMQQSNAAIMQQAAVMQMQAQAAAMQMAAWQAAAAQAQAAAASCPTIGGYSGPACTPTTGSFGFSSSSSYDADAAAQSWRQHELDLIRESGDRSCAAVTGLTYDQYKTAESMNLHQINGSADSPGANDTYFSDSHDNLYRVDMDGNAYEQVW